MTVLLMFLCLQANPTPHWPSFRGTHASGIADQQNLPDRWDIDSGENILWKIPIPGLAHSSPIVWGDQLFVLSAISGSGDTSLKHGLYGSGEASTDKSVHQFKVFCFDKNTGKLLWERLAHEGVPKEKRHIKATYANATPATDGKVLATFFGSEGLFVYDLDGKLLWKKDFGFLNVGAYNLPAFEWGSASSPIIYKDMVFLQCDTQGESFVVACSLKDGSVIWKATRDELPSWATPTIYPGSNPELITNAPNRIRSYNPFTGKELWSLAPSSNITAPTPIFSGDIMIVASGRRPEKPIFAIKKGLSGHFNVIEDKTLPAQILWHKQGAGSYMPTPIIYGEYLYVLSNEGIFDCYQLKSGKKVYRHRIPHSGGGFSASPVASDQKLFLPSEDGQVFVVAVGPEFKLINNNNCGEVIMASPAISSEKLYVRGKKHLFAIGKK